MVRRRLYRPIARVLAHPITQTSRCQVPGATYLEMVLAAGEYFLGAKGTQWHIKNVGFQAPLVLKTGDGGKLSKDCRAFRPQSWSRYLLFL